MRRMRSFFTLLVSLLNNLQFQRVKATLNKLFRETKDLNPQKVKKVTQVFLIAVFKKSVVFIKYINSLTHRNLIVGSIILISLFVISWNTELMPESNEPLIFDEDGKFVAAPPAPPSLTFPLGTDLGARSMVNLVLVGVKYTLGAVMGITLGRLLIGMLLAFITNLLYPGFKKYFSAFFWPFRYIPPLLAAIILMVPMASSPTGISAKIILEYQLIVILLIGLPGVYYYILDMMDETKKKPYVLSSKLMGASKLHVLIKHVWPNIKSHVLLLTTQQILSILQLLTFLGIFSLYLGGPHPTPLTDTPRLIYRSMSNELAGMVGQNFWLIRRAPWMAYSPILTIALIAITVNWIKKGVEDQIAGVVPVKHTSNTMVLGEKDNNPVKNFRLIGVQEHPKTVIVNKPYKSDLIREKLRVARKSLNQYSVYRKLEHFIMRISDYVYNNGKPVITTILTISFVLWAGVFSFAEYSDHAKMKSNEKDGQKSVAVSGKQEKKITDLFNTSFTNKEHVPVTYKADLTYQDGDATLKGKLQIATTNTTGADQDKIYFHLYPNQFKEPLEGENWEYVRGPSPVPGWIDIEEIKVGNQDAAFKVEGTVLEIEMKDWTDKATAELDIQFTFHLPSNYSNASYDYAAVWLGNFLPKQAVFDKNGWNLDPYSPIGYPFYSETANYDVTINAAAKYEVLSNAEETNAVIETKGETTKYHAKTENVRDFALVLLDKEYYQFDIFMTKDDTAVKVWYRPATDQQQKAHSNAMGAGQSIEYFSDFYGASLPYKELDIIRTAEGNPQMAYEGMIFTPGYNFADNDFGSLSMTDGVIRQWMSGMVGSHGYKEPWVNESLVSYSMQAYMGEKGYASRTSAEAQLKQQEEIARIQKEGQFLSSPLDKFNNINDYAVMMNIHGSNMYMELDYILKSGKVKKAMKEYVKEYQNKNASGHDLITIFEKTGQPQAKDYFNNWLKPEISE